MTRLLGILVCVLLLAGCADDPAPESPPEPEAEESTAPPADPLTKADVNGAIKAFSKAGTGSYSIRGTLVAGTPAVTHTGTYDLSTGYADELLTPASPGEAASRVRMIGIGGDSWMAVRTADVESCWMHFTPEDSQSFGVELGAGSTFGIPPVGYVVSTLKAEKDGSVTSDLYSVLLTFSAKTPRSLGIAPNSQHRVAVDLTLDDGAIAEVSASPDQLMSGLEDAGVDLAPLADLRDELALEVTLDGYGERVDVVPPPKEFTVEVTESQQQFEADRTECDQRLADSS